MDPQHLVIEDFWKGAASVTVPFLRIPAMFIQRDRS